MDLQTAIKIMNGIHGGTNVHLEWRRPAKTRKGVLDCIEKATVATGRMKLDYDAQKVVQAKRESGDLPAQNAGFPKYGNGNPIYHWFIEDQIIQKLDQFGNPLPSFYLRLYRGSSPLHQPKVTWLRDGKPVAFEDIAPDLLASEKTEKDGDCFMVRLECVNVIGGDPLPVKPVQDDSTAAKQKTDKPVLVLAPPF